MVAFRDQRQSKLLSIRDLAKRAGVSPQTVATIENGSRLPRPSTMVKLAEALGIEAGQIDEFAESIKRWKESTPAQRRDE